MSYFIQIDIYFWKQMLTPNISIYLIRLQIFNPRNFVGIIVPQAKKVGTSSEPTGFLSVTLLSCSDDEVGMGCFLDSTRSCTATLFWLLDFFPGCESKAWHCWWSSNRSTHVLSCVVHCSTSFDVTRGVEIPHSTLMWSTDVRLLLGKVVYATVPAIRVLGLVSY